MAFDKSFLEDEVRLGFYIPSAVKEAWAAELEILEEINKICRRNSIKYFADWGSFLGAVRHRGFVPWDDDLDIVMLREDYDKFLSVAPAMLPEGYKVSTFRNTDNFVEFHAVVINTEHPRFDKDHFDKFHGFPYSCGIDVFVLDFVHPNEEDEMRRIHEATYTIAFADGFLSHSFNSAALKEGFAQIEQIYGVKLDLNKPDKELWIDLYELADKKCAEVTKNESDTLAQMVPWGLKNLRNKRYRYDEYLNAVNVPFEYTEIPLPLRYNQLLSVRYGNYMKLIKNGGAHDYPYFIKQKKEFESILGSSISDYSYNPSNVAESEVNSWKPIVSECLENLSSLTESIAASTSDICELICDAQDLAVNLGNFIESLKGENHACIKFLEDYCDKLFGLYSVITGESEGSLSTLLSELTASYSSLKNEIETRIISVKEVVFLPFKSDYWEKMAPLYDYYKGLDSYDVYVVPIPYYFKNYDTTLSNEQYDLTSYPKELNVISYTDFSMEYHHPDIIVIQSPYDEFNAATSVHPDFYSENLKKYCDSLYYVPWFETYDFTSANEREYANMNYYVTVPGIINSDVVYVQSDCLRHTYINKLTEWAGNNTRNLWETKIKVNPFVKSEKESSSSVKTILYYIGQSNSAENEETFIPKIKNTLNTFKINSASIRLIFLPDPLITETLDKYIPDKSDEFNRVISEFKTEGFGVFCSAFSEDLLKTCDAFYGDAGYIATEFMAKGKPVMLQNYQV